MMSTKKQKTNKNKKHKTNNKKRKRKKKKKKKEKKKEKERKKQRKKKKEKKKTNLCEDQKIQLFQKVIQKRFLHLYLHLTKTLNILCPILVVEYNIYKHHHNKCFHEKRSKKRFYKLPNTAQKYLIHVDITVN
jgi:hypothetical protein